MATRTELAGHALESGTLSMVAPLLVHHHARLYPSPHAFVPERFASAAPDPAAWIPFGGGARHCLGAELALVEMEVVIKELLATFRLAPAATPGESARLTGTVLAPARGATLSLSRRP